MKLAHNQPSQEQHPPSSLAASASASGTVATSHVLSCVSEALFNVQELSISPSFLLTSQKCDSQPDAGEQIWEDTVTGVLSFSFQIIPQDAATSRVCNMAMPRSTRTRNKLKWKGAFIWGSRALLHAQLLHTAVSSQQSQSLPCPNTDNSTAWQHKPQTQNYCATIGRFFSHTVSAQSYLPCHCQRQPDLDRELYSSENKP